LDDVSARSSDHDSLLRHILLLDSIQASIEQIVEVLSEPH
jgi:hypothetical protein